MRTEVFLILVTVFLFETDIVLFCFVPTTQTQINELRFSKSHGNGDRVKFLDTLRVGHNGAEDGGGKNCQAKGHRACAVAVVRRAAVGAGLDGEEGNATRGAG